MTDDEMTTGEVQRWLERIDKNVDALRGEMRERHHQLAGEVTAVVVPVSTLSLRVENNEGAIKQIEKDLRTVQLRAAAMSGALGLAGFLLNLLWKAAH